MLDILFNYDFSVIIYDYLNIDDLLKIPIIIDHIPPSFSKIKRDVHIHNFDYGRMLIKFFKRIKLRMDQPIYLQKNLENSKLNLEPFSSNLVELNLEDDTHVHNDELKHLAGKALV